MEIKLHITNVPLNLLEQLLDRNAIEHKRRNSSRFGWDGSSLSADGKRVGYIEPCRGQSPLTCVVDLGELDDQDQVARLIYEARDLQKGLLAQGRG